MRKVDLNKSHQAEDLYNFITNVVQQHKEEWKILVIGRDKGLIETARVLAEGLKLPLVDDYRAQSKGCTRTCSQAFM